MKLQIVAHASTTWIEYTLTIAKILRVKNTQVWVSWGSNLYSEVRYILLKVTIMSHSILR